MGLAATIEQVIELARKRNAAETERKKGRPAAAHVADCVKIGLEEEETNLLDFLLSLPPATIYMTTAIMYLGRGDFATSDGLMDQYTYVSNNFPDPKLASSQMFEKMPLPEYLEKGLKIIQNEKIDSLLSE